MDTIEVTLPWHALPEGYGRLKAAAQRVAPGAHFGAHWSHVYPDGACQYMTLRLDPAPLEDLPEHPDPNAARVLASLAAGDAGDDDDLSAGG